MKLLLQIYKHFAYIYLWLDNQLSVYFLRLPFSRLKKRNVKGYIKLIKVLKN